MFERFLALVTAHKSSRQITWKKIGWLDVRGSIRDVCIWWVARHGRLQFKFVVARALVKPKNQLRSVVATGSLMAEMKHNLHCGRLDY